MSLPLHPFLVAPTRSHVAYASIMRSALIRVVRVFLVFGLSGWLTGVLLLSTNDDTTMLGAAGTGTALQCAAAGLLISVIFGPLLAWLRPPTWAGALMGPLASTTGIYTFFWLWPHSWQPSRWAAWKSVGVVADAYWEYLLPGALVAGAFVAWWVSRDVRPTSLELETSKLEAEEAETRRIALAEAETRRIAQSEAMTRQIDPLEMETHALAEPEEATQRIDGLTEETTVLPPEEAPTEQIEVADAPEQGG